MPGPLDGVKVLDLSRYQNGPHATLMMADYGADVLKVEHVKGGDPGRNNRSSDGYQWYHEAFNRGKRSLALDLRHPDAKPVVRELVKWADVLAENFKPGFLDSIGLGYADLKEVNPSLIYASNSGFGERGDWAERGSFDVVCQGFSGMAVAQGGGVSHKPMFVENGVADQVGAMNFAYAIVAALYAREKRGGKGQRIETSQLGACISLQAFWLTPFLHSGRQRDDGNPPWHGSLSLMLQRASDGWFTVAPTEQKFWPRVCKAIERPDLKEDHRSVDMSARFKNAEWLHEELAKEFVKMPRDHWIKELLVNDVPCGPCYDYAGLREEPQVWENEYLVELEHPKFGKQE